MAGDWVCLMYHDVAQNDVSSVGGSEFFSVREQTFARHLSLLRDAGLAGCTIASALPPGEGERNRIAISFDDGNLGQANRAFPALVASGMAATFFVTTDWVGRPGFATWDQLREMRDAGMAIESHTHTHPFLSELNEQKLRDELARSRDAIAEQLGAAPTMIALPGGDAPRRELRHIIAREGYDLVASSQWGVNRRGDEKLRWIRRCTVRGESGDQAFVSIATGDRWLRLRKHARETTLALMRRSLGPTRYARLRRGFLERADSLRGSR